MRLHLPLYSAQTSPSHYTLTDLSLSMAHHHLRGARARAEVCMGRRRFRERTRERTSGRERGRENKEERQRGDQAFPSRFVDSPHACARHRRTFARALASGALPSSLMHPLRNVPLVRFDRSVVRVDVCVGIITKVAASIIYICIYIYICVYQLHLFNALLTKVASRTYSCVRSRA